MVQSVASVGSDLWPSLSTILSTPRRALRQVRRRDVQLPRTNHPQNLVSEQVQERSLATIVLPECLESVSMAALRCGPSRPLSTPLSAWVALARKNIWSPPHIPRIPVSTRPSQKRSFSSSPSPFVQAIFGPPGRGSNFARSQKRKFSTTFQPANQNQLAHTERTANNNPTSATAQSAFYSALLRANMPKIVIERYQTGRYATNAAADAAYLKALQMTGSVPAPGNSGSGNVGQPGGISQDTLQAVGQAVPAQSYGGQVGS